MFIAIRHRRPWPWLAVCLAVLGPGRQSWADPALWRASGGAATVYLFGAVHALKPETRWRTAKLDAAIAEASALWLEAADLDDAAQAEALVRQYGFDPSRPLAERLPADVAERLQAVLRAAGVKDGMGQLAALRPWLVATGIEDQVLQKLGYTRKDGVEAALRAAMPGKPVHGFETLAQQIHVFADLPPEDEVAYLRDVLREMGNAEQELAALNAAWLAGDDAGLAGLLLRDEDGGLRHLHAALFTARNRRFADGMAELLRGGGTALVAVGAGHLLGEDGAPALLRQAGFRVERIQ